MSQTKKTATDLDLAPKLSEALAKEGGLSIEDAKAALDVSDWEFVKAVVAAKRELEVREGRFIRGKSGVLVERTLEQTLAYVRDRLRHRIVEAAERHAEALVNVQRREDLDETMREILNEDEIKAMRNLRQIRRLELKVLREERRPADLQRDE